MTAVDPVPRRSASKKRHTKPCKFYQLKQCPLSAEVCDFAHVTAPDEPPAHPTNRKKLCRYFLAGNCPDGAKCRFRHAPEGSEDGRRPSENKKTDRPLRKNSSIVPPYQDASEFIGNDYIPGIEQAHLVSYPGPLYPPLSPGYVPWVPYGIPGYPHGSNSLDDSTANLTSPTATSSSESAPSVRTHSGSSGSMTDEAVIDYVMSLQTKAAASPVTSAPSTSPNTPVSPTFARTPTVTTPSSSYLPEQHARWTPKSLNRPTRSQSLSNLPSSARQKQSYKTKPCKFYKVDNACPKGDLCTFIHDKTSLDSHPPHTRNSSAPTEQQITSKLQQQEPHGLPDKPTTLREEKKKKGFYPISWRVIGGGVMIGGRRFDEPRTKPMIDATPSNNNNLSMKKATLLGSDLVQARVDLGKNSGPLLSSRGRSKSISVTPTSERVDVLTLFSAESPGGL